MAKKSFNITGIKQPVKKINVVEEQVKQKVKQQAKQIDDFVMRSEHEQEPETSMMFYLPVRLKKKIKVKAANNNITIKAMINNAIEQYLESNK